MRYFACLLFSLSLFAGDLVDQLTFDGDALYQDILVNGEAIYRGDRSCEERYQSIKPILDQYDRPITVLDIGANNGYFSLRIAEEYDATTVMVDFTDRLTEICKLNTDRDNIIYLKKGLRTKDLKALNEQEHFDVAILFHVLHHIHSPDTWEDFLQEVFKIADHVIIQTPPENDGFVVVKPNIPAIAEHLLSLPNGKVIGSFPRQSEEIKDHMILFSNPSSGKKAKHQGISLENFEKFHGTYPTKEMIDAEKKKLPFYKRYFKKAITVQGTLLK